MRIIRVMCSGSVSPHHVLRAFQEGVDGVFIGGCHLGDCHYQTGNIMTDRRMRLLRKLLPFYGIAEERLRVRWVSSAEAPDLVEALTDFTHTLMELGPSPLRGDARMGRKEERSCSRCAGA